MSRTTANSAQGLATTSLCAALAVEALRIDERLLAVLALLAATGVATLTLDGLRRTTRNSFELRSDLADWVRRFAAATGDTDRHVVERAIARFRGSMEPDDGSDVSDAA